MANYNQMYVIAIKLLTFGEASSLKINGLRLAFYIFRLQATGADIE